MTGRRMHDEPGRLVDHQQPLVLVQHVERNGLGFDAGGQRRRRRLDVDALSGAQHRSRLHALAVHAGRVPSLIRRWTCDRDPHVPSAAR